MTNAKAMKVSATNHAQYLTLGEYEALAVGYLAKRRQYRLLKSEDAVSYLMEAMMRADAIYEKKARQHNRKTWRVMACRFAVRRLLSKSSYQTTIERLPNGLISTPNRPSITEFLDDFPLSDREKFVLRLYYDENETQASIGQRLGVTKVAVHKLMKCGLKTIRMALSERNR